MIRPVLWKNNAVVLIDQNALPQTERQVICADYRQVIACIKDLTVRGAPAIGVAAAMGAALGAGSIRETSVEKFLSRFKKICDEIAAARPTARNLFWALEHMQRCLEEALAGGCKNPVQALIAEAKRLCAEDIEINKQMGRHGSALLRDGDNILTHCNAGALATAGYGTALGVIRAARDEGKRLHVFVDEKRKNSRDAHLRQHGGHSAAAG